MSGLGIEQLLSARMDMRHQQRMSLGQVEEWQMNPWQMIEREHPVFSRMTSRRHSGVKNLEGIYKKIRDTQILGDKPGDLINIDIIGPNGAGKGILGQGFAEVIRRDEYLQQEAAKLGIEVIVLSDIFAINITALKLENLRRSPWAIPAGIEHGQFSPEHYQRSDGFSFQLREEIHKNISSGVRVVKISERPAPTSYPIDRDVPPKVKGVNRAHASLYADAYDPRVRDKTNFFILRRAEQVRQMASEDRRLFADRDQVDNPFTGHNKIWITSAAGAIYDVSTLTPKLQEETLELLLLGSASPQAMVRGDLEMYELVDDLYAQQKIQTPDIDSYLDFLGDQLISKNKRRPGLRRSQVHDVENLAYSSDRTEYHMNNLTHNNPVVMMYPGLLKPNLRRFVFGN